MKAIKDTKELVKKNLKKERIQEKMEQHKLELAEKIKDCK